MDRTPVTSSAIKSVGHDPDANIIEVEFHNGTIEQHADRTAGDFDAFVGAESVGKHYHANYRGKGVVPPKADDQAF